MIELTLLETKKMINKIAKLLYILFYTIIHLNKVFLLADTNQVFDIEVNTYEILKNELSTKFAWNKIEMSFQGNDSERYREILVMPCMQQTLLLGIRIEYNRFHFLQFWNFRCG
jgi:hypothetical protein